MSSYMIQELHIQKQQWQKVNRCRHQ